MTIGLTLKKLGGKKGVFPKHHLWADKVSGLISSATQNKNNKLLIYSLQQNTEQLPYLGSKVERNEMRDKDGNKWT